REPSKGLVATETASAPEDRTPVEEVKTVEGLAPVKEMAIPERTALPNPPAKEGTEQPAPSESAVKPPPPPQETREVKAPSEVPPEGIAPSEGRAETKAPEEGKPEPKVEPDVIYVPTPNDVVEMMLHLARVKKDDVVYDLGCGDGRIVVAAAKTYGCKAAGYDIDPERVAESKANVEKNGVQNLVTIEKKDIFTLDLTQASVITLYLLPELNVRLIPQLEKLKPGCRIVSHEFDIAGVKPDAVLTMDSKEDDMEHIIYLWTTPLKKEPVIPEEDEGDEDDPVEDD
ncbi:MAG: SAM-dependent methyltransferase, partial [Planctomycetota bacterium]